MKKTTLSLAVNAMHIGSAEADRIGAPAYVLAANRFGGLHLISHHETHAAAQSAQSATHVSDPLQVVPATVVLAPNGNVRYWKVRQQGVGA